jgi:hypothetical protein
MEVICSSMEDVRNKISKANGAFNQLQSLEIKWYFIKNKNMNFQL